MHCRDSVAEPQQYEFAHERDVIKLDRFLPSSVVYKQLEIGLDEHGRAVVLNVAPKRFSTSTVPKRSAGRSPRTSTRSWASPTRLRPSPRPCASA